MTFSRAALALAAFSSFAAADPVHDGHASAELIVGSADYEAGKPIHVGIRIIVDEGWHTYWINPGEAGSKPAISWTLPAGWKASDLSFPAPKRFLTGGLPGYGYEGEVVFPVTLTPDKKASGPLEVTATVSWLTCNDFSCVPGKAELKLPLGGEAVPSAAAAEAIAAATARVPKPLEDAKLVVRESGNRLSLSLTIPVDSKLDPAGSEVFPVTLQAIDYSKPVRFEKTGPTWSASATKSEYAEGPLKELRLVLAKKEATPVEVFWESK